MLASRKPLSVFTTTPVNDPAEESPGRPLNTQYDVPVGSPSNSQRGSSRNGLFSPLGSSPNLVFRSGSASNLVSEASSPGLIKSISGLSIDSSNNNGLKNADADASGSPFESSVPIVAAGADILVPMLDRPEEMAELLANPCNSRLVNLLNSTLGADLYKKAELLWTEVPRCQGRPGTDGSEGKRMDDPEWLFETRKLLVGTLNGDKVLWRQWCDMVGWDDNSPSPVPVSVPASGSGSGSGSGTALNFTQNPSFDSEGRSSNLSSTSHETIHEEDEE